MLFNRSLPAPAGPTSITILDDSDLVFVVVHIFLGIWLDCKLSFQTHIKHLQSKIKIPQQSLLHSSCQTYPHKTDYPTDPRLRRSHLKKIASNNLLSKLDVVYHSAIRFVTKSPYTTHHCDLYAFVGWPSLHIHCQTHWLQVIYKSLLGKAPPYLSSLVTYAPPSRSTRSSRYISLVAPKPTSSLAAFPSSFLLPMTGTNCKSHWSWRLISLHLYTAYL